MRILLLTTDVWGSSGGIALYNRDIVEAIVAQPEVREVVVVARNLRFPAGPLPQKVRFVTSAANSKVRWLMASAFELTSRFDLVICGHINLLAVARHLNFFWRAPLVLMVYGIDVWQAPARVSAVKSLGAVDAFWTISAITRDKMCSWSGLSASRFRLLPNAIHLDRYGIHPLKKSLQQRWGLEGHKVVLTLARLVSHERYKGVDEVIEAMPALLRREPSLRYVVAGDGSDRQRLEEKVFAAGLEKSVIFTGFIAEEDKADLYRLADVFVMPGRGEGFGFVFLEALACGTPAVGSRVDGSREALRDGLLGEVIDPDSRGELVEAVLHALSKPREVPEGLNFFAWPAWEQRAREALFAATRRPTAR